MKRLYVFYFFITLSFIFGCKEPDSNISGLQLSEEKRFIMTASLDNYVFFAGGANQEGMVSTVEILNVSTGEVMFSNLSKRRSRGVGVAIGRKVIFAGGEECNFVGLSSCSTSSTVDIYDVDTKTWSVSTLSIARLELAAAVTSDGYAVFAGGDSSPASDAVDIYNSNTSTWSVANLPAEPRFGLSGVAVGTKVYFAGGSGPDSTGVTKTTRIDIFEPSTGTWTTQNMSVARRYFASVVIGSKIYFTGGQLDCWPCLNSNVVDIFDTSTSSWSTSTISIARELLAGASDGTVAVFAGGDSNNGQELDVVDVFDSLNNTWSTNNLSRARTNIAVAVNGNRAYFAGGNFDTNGFSNTIDIFDFSKKKFINSKH